MREIWRDAHGAHARDLVILSASLDRSLVAVASRLSPPIGVWLSRLLLCVCVYRRAGATGCLLLCCLQAVVPRDHLPTGGRQQQKLQQADDMMGVLHTVGELVSIIHADAARSNILVEDSKASKAERPAQSREEVDDRVRSFRPLLPSFRGHWPACVHAAAL